jgi:hypothetical protein
MAISFMGGGNPEYTKKIADLSEVADKLLSHNVVSSTPRVNALIA